MVDIVSIEKDVVYEYVINGPLLEDIKVLFTEYAASLNISLAFQGFEDELQALPGKYSPPGGTLIIAIVDGVSAGCIALRKISEGICEMKRLYVRPEYRKLGIGKKLVDLIIEEGKKLNYGFMRLDTLSSMKKAQALYEAYGFYDIEPYTYNPIEGARYMELRL